MVEVGPNGVTHEFKSLQELDPTNSSRGIGVGEFITLLSAYHSIRPLIEIRPATPSPPRAVSGQGVVQRNPFDVLFNNSGDEDEDEQEEADAKAAMARYNEH